MSRPRWADKPQAPCARCGQPTWSTSVPPLHRACRPRAAPRPSTSWAERKRRRAFLDAYRAEYGDVCPGWRREPHYASPRNPLTADHAVSVYASGDESGVLQPLCRACNSSKREQSGVVGQPAARARSSPSGTC